MHPVMNFDEVSSTAIFDAAFRMSIFNAEMTIEPRRVIKYGRVENVRYST
jgi:hypothetical protein